MGMSMISWPRFALLNFIAAGLWANSFVWVGYMLGVAFEAVLGAIAKDFGLVMLGIFATVGIVLFFVHRRSKARFQARISAQTPAAHTPDPHPATPPDPSTGSFYPAN